MAVGNVAEILNDHSKKVFTNEMEFQKETQMETIVEMQAVKGCVLKECRDQLLGPVYKIKDFSQKGRDSKSGKKQILKQYIKMEVKWSL